MNGRTIKLRLIEPNDAAFVFGLRTDPRYNTHLSKVAGTAGDQRVWIEQYKQREAAGGEYYYIILSIGSDVPIGTVRLYDFHDDRASFSWGSWILNENKTRYAAIESAMLVYEIGFETLGFKSCHFEVRKENERVISFHEKFGAVRTGEDAINYYFSLSPQTYAAFRQKNVVFLAKG